LKLRPALLIAIIGLLIAAVVWHWRMSFPFDDAYITFRYAENLANGYGIVWNIGGPHTEGYTNFLLVLILSPFAYFNADLLIVSQFIGIALTILTALVIFKFIRQISESDGWPVAAALLYLLLPYTWANAFSGLETSLFVLLVTSSFYFAVCRKWTVAFILVSLASLARPEGALAGVILAISLYRINKSERGLAIRSMLTFFMLPIALYAGFKFFYFGDLLPNSFYIKTGNGGFQGIQNSKGFIRSNVILIVISIYALWRYRDKWRSLTPLLLWSCGLLLFYVWPEPLQGFYFRFDWPAVPALAIFATLALSPEKWNWRSFVILTVVIASQIVLTFPRLRNETQLATLERGRQIYHELGFALRSIPNHERMTFAFQDAGAVPYYSEMKNIDLVGLNTTAIAKARSAHEACSILDSLQPDIMLIPAYHDTGKCWMVFHDGHGKAGKLIPELIHQPSMAHYICAGRITYLGYDILCYVLPKYAQTVSTEFSKYGWFVAGAIPCLQ
jgi:arabinofuranosyltransferase